MASLEWPDHHHVNATIGWLMLGNVKEARVEFEKLSAPSRRHPEVLGIEWNLLAKERRWVEAVVAAESRLTAMPDEPEPWIHRSFALHELRHTRDAFDFLLPAAERFPKESTIAYNLACYACQLGDLETARSWLRKSFAAHSDQAEREIRVVMAMADPDLQPLGDELRRGDFA